MKTESFAHAAVNASQRELARVIEEMTQQLLDDPNVDLSPLIAQYPQHAEQLEYLLPAVQLMADVSRGGERAAPLHAHVDAKQIADGTLGDFRLLREVGRGGMGVVYEAEQISLRRKVALKVLPFAALLDDRQIARFENEARAAATLYHANIVPVFFVGSARGVHFYAMQLIEGCSLAEAIAELSVERPEKANADLVCRDAPVANPLGRAERAPRQQPSSDDPFPIPHSLFDTDVAAALSTQRATNPKQYFHRVAELGIQVATALDHAAAPLSPPPIASSSSCRCSSHPLFPQAATQGRSPATWKRSSSKQSPRMPTPATQPPQISPTTCHVSSKTAPSRPVAKVARPKQSTGFAAIARWQRSVVSQCFCC